MQATDHYRADRTSTSRAGLVRGVLVMLTAVSVGAFVVARGIDDPQAGRVAAGEEQAAAPGDASSTVPAGSTASSGVASATATSAATATTAPTTAASSTSSTATTASSASALRPPADVLVIVLNGAGTSGIAAAGSTILEDAGYGIVEPENATEFGPSAIIYDEGYDAEADVVAELFGVASAGIVSALDPAAPPGDELGGANVIVVIGDDGVIDPT
jgi:hypothetical protein